jgi:fermentation-respiration switch protein FrsA (DUF1100 family)
MPVLNTMVSAGDVPLAVRVHRPDADPTEPLPTVVVMGSWLTVREQMADHYAAALAARGLAAVTFDFAGFGASGGTLRQTEQPARKVADLTAVTRYLAGLSTVAGRPGVLGVCASAQYALAALAAGAPVASFASVAGWFHDARSVAAFYGGAPGVTARLDRADDAARRFTTTGTLDTVPAYAPGDDRAGMTVEMDYYANPDRGAVPAWTNAMTELTWSHWLTFDGIGPAAAVDAPAVFVHSGECVFPDHVKQVAAALRRTPALVWGEGAQTDFYDRPAQVGFALDAVEDHFRRTL